MDRDPDMTILALRMIIVMVSAPLIGYGGRLMEAGWFRSGGILFASGVILFVVAISRWVSDLYEEWFGDERF